MKNVAKLDIEGELQIYATSIKTGKPLLVFKEINKIMDEAKAYLLRALYDPAFVVEPISTFKVGNGGTLTPSGVDVKPVPGDRVDLFTPYNTGYTNTVPAPSISIDGKTVTFNYSVPDTDLNGQYINEVGMFRSGGTLYNMKTFPSILKTSGFSLTFVWTIRHK